MTMVSGLGLHDWDCIIGKGSGDNGSVGFDFIDSCISLMSALARIRRIVSLAVCCTHILPFPFISITCFVNSE
jgi:hypothetical protein